jgi:hypothetical protein
MSETSIFTITTLRDDPMKAGRCVGFYFDISKATIAVIENHQDIYENGYYPCVIEEVKDGIYFLNRKELWFKWNNDRHCYTAFPGKPKKFSKLVCFGIG